MFDHVLIKVPFSFPDTMFEMQKTSSIHAFIVEIQQIIESCDLKEQNHI